MRYGTGSSSIVRIVYCVLASCSSISGTYESITKIGSPRDVPSVSTSLSATTLQARAIDVWPIAAPDSAPACSALPEHQPTNDVCVRRDAPLGRAWMRYCGVLGLIDGDHNDREAAAYSFYTCPHDTRCVQQLVLPPLGQRLICEPRTHGLNRLVKMAKDAWHNRPGIATQGRRHNGGRGYRANPAVVVPSSD